MDKTVTFVVQGPVASCTNRQIQACLRTKGCKRVIVSCWDTCDTSDVNTHDPRCNLVITYKPDLGDYQPYYESFGFDPSQFNGLLYQTLSLQAALEGDVIKTDYVVKLRSDEHARDWNALVERLQPGVLTCTNMFAFHHTTVPFHVSDHAFGCESSILVKMASLLTKALVSCDADMLSHMKTVGAPEQVPPLNPEQLVGVSFHMALGVNTPRVDILDAMSVPEYHASYVSEGGGRMVGEIAENARMQNETVFCKDSHDWEHGNPGPYEEMLVMARKGMYMYKKSMWKDSLRVFIELIHRGVVSPEISLNAGVCSFQMGNAAYAERLFANAREQAIRAGNTDIADRCTRNINACRA